MRLSDDLRRCVAFIGILDGTVPSGIRCFGTGFFVAYKGFRYFVTNQHIAAGIGHSPFAIRLNRTDGTSINVSIDLTEDNLKWICNTNDPDVDLAVMPMNYDFCAGGFNVLYVPEVMIRSTQWLMTEEDMASAIFAIRLACLDC